jgi:sugar/nucleoside kinase (ribokinase family)
MLATLGDLVEDMVVHLDGPIRIASDRSARITRRRGGSAANLTATAAFLGHPCRFIGQVGDDTIGRALVAELGAAGVDTSCVRFAGTTGTIVVLVDDQGERSMLTDRRACLELDRPDEVWLDGVTILHVPLYSIAAPPLSETAITLIDRAHRLGIPVSIDASSVAVIESFRPDVLRSLLVRLAPTVVFANADEAAALGDDSVAAALTVVKRGARSAMIHRPGVRPVHVPAESIGQVTDTTGAGDAFAAGYLTSDDWQHDPETACVAAHGAAADLIRRRLAPPVVGNRTDGR